MEPAAGRLPLQVLGENEALQQFFSGQDVRGVLDSSVAVDTSILEQFLSNDMDPNSFMLPESPPDSSSEACSPAQIPDFHCEASYWSNHQNIQPTQRPGPSTSCRFKARGPAHPELMTHDQLRTLGLTNTLVKSGTSPDLPHTHRSPEHTHYLSPEGCPQVYAPPPPSAPPPPPPLAPSNSYAAPCAGPSLVPSLSTPPSSYLLDSTPSLHTW
ncbi:Myelin regulatory factor-like protein [Liparis tanakae]|uniref:Myelin regulatory factor-like protein n=1 Tax=Liparis tanakae TaxID=230148 RepID=A0A4Z2G398_9TELE|nr:Myelin regulatory factor-like protein [Liparis tanakae]